VEVETTEESITMNTTLLIRGLVALALSCCLFTSCGKDDRPESTAPAGPKSLADIQPGTLSLEEIRKGLEAPGAHDAFRPEKPFGLVSSLVIPEENPCTPAKVELGRQLYFDVRLSKDETVSCATCHDPSKGWTDNLPVSKGIDGKTGTRSAPTVINRATHAAQFWDGRAPSLEEQAKGPIANPVEMGFTLEAAAKRINGIEGYRIQFERIFKGAATADTIAQAIAAFERTILSGGAPYDYWVAWKSWKENPPTEAALANPKVKERYERAKKGWEEHRMSDAAMRGMELFFGKAECSLCHVGDNFTDEQYWNLGIGMDKEDFDKGREVVTGLEKDRGAFRTPTLRNIKETAPYMHDGSLKTLTDVVEHYNKGGTPNPWLSKRIKKLNLTPKEVQDVVTFMEEALQGTVTSVALPRLP